MALTFIGQDSFPTYIALSTDVSSGSPLEGANHIGKTVFITDIAVWSIIDADLNLQPFKFPS